MFLPQARYCWKVIVSQAKLAQIHAVNIVLYVIYGRFLAVKFFVEILFARCQVTLIYHFQVASDLSWN